MHIAPSNRQIALIDPTVEAWDCLAAGVNDGVEVVVLDPARDAIAQITQELSKRPNIEAIHLVSHGAPGTLFLGQTTVDAHTLNNYRGLLNCWAGLDVLLYGCRVAAGAIGQRFLQQLQTLTNGRIFASNTLVGNHALGGRWELQAIAPSTPTPSLAFSTATTLAYPAVLTSFAAASDFNIGNSPRAIVVADFNGDTRLDVAIANNNSTDVSVLLGDGTGGFSPQTVLPTGARALAIATGLFDNNAELDLVVPSRLPPEVFLLSGDGTGSFAAPSSVNNTVNGPSAIAVGRFNNDANLDLAITNDNPNNVLLLLGDGMEDSPLKPPLPLVRTLLSS